MDQLWAPWRLEYILSDKAGDCFLCHSVSATVGDRDTLLLKRGPQCGVIMNRYPYNNGHLLIFPYRHVAEICDLSADEKAEIMDLLDESVSVLKAEMHPDGFNVGINLGLVAGAGLAEHVHMHIVPRWSGDTNFMPVMADVKSIPQALTQLYDQLLPVFSR
jgi:ATP adenylyltransferase